MIYIGILTLLLFLFFRYDFCGKKSGRMACYYAVLVILILLAGLRWRLGSDTPIYMRQFFHETPLLWNLHTEDVMLGLKPFWKLLNSVVYTFFGKFYILQLIHATIVNILFFTYFKKHSQYIFFCVILYFFWLYLNMSMQIMKASFSIAICLFANDYLIERKWIKSYSLYFVALLFHPQTALLLFMPFFLKLRLNTKGSLILFISFITGLAIQHFLGDFLFVFEAIGDDTIMNKASDYTNIIVEADNSFLRMVTSAGILICEFLSILYVKKRTKLDISNIEPFLMLGMATILVQINVELFYRYVFYFSFYFIILFSYIAQYIVNNNRILSRGLLFAKVLMFFLPLLICIHANRFFQLTRYVPYYSIWEMKVDKAREKYYMKDGKPAANKKEY
jgi:hypothetical protein